MKISGLFGRSLFLIVALISFSAQSQVHSRDVNASGSQKIWDDYIAVLPQLQLKFAAKAKTPLMRTSLDLRSANLALVSASTNKVTSLNSLSKYDPPPGPIGFCFGRAFATQTYAMMQGLKESSIRKLFIIGDLRSTPEVPEWGFHVTTLVLGDDQKWYAIDPIYSDNRGRNMPIPASTWIKWVRDNWDTWHKQKPKAFLYLTEATAMMPDVRKYPEGIIDSKGFDPAAHGIAQDAGITAEFKDQKVFVLNPEQTNEFFLNFNGRRADKTFDFAKLTIQTETFDFRNYFADFNQTLLNLPTNEALSRSADTFRGPRPLGLNLHQYRRR